MANYYATERTNYFLVNNEEGFLEDVQTFLGNYEILRKEKDGKTYFAILGDYDNGQGLPDYYEHEGDTFELEWADFFKAHLAEGSVAIIMHAGNEKMRYVMGYAYAYNWKGEVKTIDLRDIYELAKELGNDITEVEF